MSKFKPIDIDAEFEDVYFDEQSINRDTGIVKRAESIWSKSQKLKWQDTKFTAYHKKTIQERSARDSWKQNQKIGYEKRKNNVQWQQKQNEWHKNKSKKPDYLKLMQDTNRNTANKKEWILKNCCPVKCPYGIFLKTKLAMECYHKDVGGNEGTNRNRVRKMLKDPNNLDWQYLTFEEYIKLTGQNPFEN